MEGSGCFLEYPEGRSHPSCPSVLSFQRDIDAGVEEGSLGAGPPLGLSTCSLRLPESLLLTDTGRHGPSLALGPIWLLLSYKFSYFFPQWHSSSSWKPRCHFFCFFVSENNWGDSGCDTTTQVPTVLAGCCVVTWPQTLFLGSMDLAERPQRKQFTQQPALKQS